MISIDVKSRIEKKKKKQSVLATWKSWHRHLGISAFTASAWTFKYINYFSHYMSLI